MITEAEIRRLAASARVDPMVLDLDYSLGWFLAGLASLINLPGSLVFKGGTCLRKCYFDGYRFSEDLDFTAVSPIRPGHFQTLVTQVSEWSLERGGPNFDVQPARIEIVADEYGSESVQIKAYYRGPLVWGGSPRAIQVDITWDEILLTSPTLLHLIHPYSDLETLDDPMINCYTLDEILLEKLRAISGQRRFAISRDLYDIYHLVHAGQNLTGVMPLIAEKFLSRGVEISEIDPLRFQNRKPEFELDWQRRLSYLVAAEQPVSFEDAWRVAVETLNSLKFYK